MRRLHLTAAALDVTTMVVALAGICLLVRPAFAQTAAVDLDTVLDRAAGYVAQYQERLSAVVAEEEYVQRDQTPARRSSSTRVTTAPVRARTLRADMLLVRPDASAQWLQFRDVFEVDGAPVRDRDDRLARLFLDPSPSSFAQAAAILDESSRFNLGSLIRTVNMPLLALTILEAGNQHRFAFSRANPGDLRPFDGLAIAADVWAVDFRETRPETLVRGLNDRDIPVQGRFWIDAASGTILRSELVVDDGETRGRITVSYHHEPGLDLLVPAEMREEHTGASGIRLFGTATYSRFRRFGVTVDETIAAPPN